jgi:hypothetical protein
MRRLLMLMALSGMLAACGAAAADEPEVASLSTSPAGNATTDSSDSTDGATETTAITDPNEAAVQFAKCMREHGVDMPDPVINDDGGVLVQVGGESDGEAGSGPDPKELDAANKECKHFMEDAAGSIDPLSEEDQKKMQEEALAFSKCMREHGIDMPDPQFSADGGGFNVSIGSPNDAPSDGPTIDFNSDEFKEASTACGQPNGGFSVQTKPAGG